MIGKALLSLLLAAPVHAVGAYILGPTISTTTGKAAETIAGTFSVAPSSASVNSPTIVLDGAKGGVNASSATLTYGVKAATGAFSGNVTAGSFTGNITGNVTGNAATATALAAAPSACSLPQLALGIAANGNASCSQPSTISGNAATATALAAAPSQCAAGNFPLGIDVSGNAQSCTSVAAGLVSEPFTTVNYVVWTASGSSVAYSTGTRVFSIAPSTFVFHGAGTSVGEQHFNTINSTYTAVTWNPTNGFRQWGLHDFQPASVSSYTAVVWKDDLIVAVSSCDSNGVVYMFGTQQLSPTPSVLMSFNQRGVPSNPAQNNPIGFWDCADAFYAGCITHTATLIPVAGPEVSFEADFNGNVSYNKMVAVVVNNPTPSSANMKCVETDNGDINTNSNHFVSVNGGSNGGNVTSLSVSSNVGLTNVSIPVGYSNVEMYIGTLGASSAGFAMAGIVCTLPPGVSVVRNGFF